MQDGNHWMKLLYHNIDLTGNGLSKLSDMPNEISGYFYCNNNKLKNLIGSPKRVGDNYRCSNNLLTSLLGVPKYIGEFFECRNNSTLKDISDLWETEVRFLCYITINSDMAILPILKFNFSRNYMPLQLYEILYRNHGNSKDNIINCQYELIENGFENHARWKPE